MIKSYCVENREGIGATFLDLWWVEFHAGKELRAKLVGLPSSAALDATRASQGGKRCWDWSKNQLNP